MKLRYKVSLISLLVTTITVGICSFILLTKSGRRSIDLTVQNTLSSQSMLVSSWKRAMNEVSSGERGKTAERSLARYSFSQFAGEDAVLMSGKDALYNPTELDPSGFLSPASEQTQYVIERIGTDPYLIVCTRLKVRDTDYCVFTVRDIISVYEGMRELARQFSLIHIIALLLCGIVLILLLRIILRPIGTLQKRAGEIADGVYDRRIETQGDDEISALASSFNRMADAVETRIGELKEEADRRTMLLSALTHELKTPVTGISGNAQTLLGTVMTEEEREESLITIDEECRRIERLSQKLMQLILLQKEDELNLVPCSVAEILEKAASACEEQMKQRGLHIRIESGANMLPMETDLMVSLLTNLIDNAGKASVPGDEILLSAKGNVISVTDHGKGIPQEEIGKILEPFYRVDKSRARKEGGMGMGLALCSEIVRLHHARLEIESRLEVGTTVKVVFPDET